MSKELDLPHGFSFAVGALLSQLVWIEFQSQKKLEIRSDGSQDRILRISGKCRGGAPGAVIAAWTCEVRGMVLKTP